MSLPYVVSEAVWSAKEATETKVLKSDFERCAVTVIEIATTGFSGTLDFKGKVHELGSYANVPYIRQDQASVQTPSVTQISHITDTGTYRYVILGYWRRLQIVMTRTAGSITCGAAGSSDAKVFPWILNTETNSGSIKTAVEAINTALQSGGISQAQFAAMVTALQLIDNMISGSEAQVDVVAALPAGTNAIGKVGHDTSSLGDGRQTVATPTTAVALATSTACKWVLVTAETNNTGVIAVGGSTVVATLASRRGTPLFAGESVLILTDNLADVYIDATVATDGVTFTYGV